MYTVKYGEKIHSKIRRFVVVKPYEYEGHSICLPLTTYQSQGTKKRGVDPKTHAAVHPENGKALFAPGEARELGTRPFEVHLYSSKETLDAMTRLNFSKPCTVEHNVKVMTIGSILPGELGRLYKYYLKCQNDDEGDERSGYSDTPTSASSSYTQPAAAVDSYVTLGYVPSGSHTQGLNPTYPSAGGSRSYSQGGGPNSYNQGGGSGGYGVANERYDAQPGTYNSHYSSQNSSTFTPGMSSTNSSSFPTAGNVPTQASNHYPYQTYQLDGGPTGYMASGAPSSPANSTPNFMWDQNNAAPSSSTRNRSAYGSYQGRYAPNEYFM